MEDGCVDVEKSTHIGIHGSMGGADLMKEDEEKGWLTITLDDFVQKGPEEVAEIVKERIGDAPTIISFDVDVLEPGECPGIGFPEPGFYFQKYEITNKTNSRWNEMQRAFQLSQSSEGH